MACQIVYPFMKRGVFFLLLFFVVLDGQSQSAENIMAQLKAKLLSVKSYEAKGTLKTDVAFLKIPISNVTISYKYPDQLKINKSGGISVLPKGGIKINMASMLADNNTTALSAGRVMFKGSDMAVIKILPTGDGSDVVLTTLYVDDKAMVIRKAITTTRENGTYEMEMDYGKYAKWGLPDKAVMIFNTKDYKLPKGITFEYDAGIGNKKKDPKTLEKKGKIEIVYSSYTIN